MARFTVFRATLALVATSVFVIAGAVAPGEPHPAAAAESTVVPATVELAAVPPSDECEWYGTMSWTRRSYSYNTEYDSSDRQYEKRTWTSEPVPGHECGATWTEQFTLDYVDNDPGQDCTRVYTRTDRAEASGTGYTEIGILAGSAEYPYYLSAYAYADQPFTVSSSGTIVGCGDNLSSTSSYEHDANIAVGCTGLPGNVIPVESAEVQSVSYTCTMPYEETNDSGTVTTAVEEYVVDLRRNTCDPAVDTDTDGLPDCTELDETGTDPNNPDTDGDGFDDGADACALEPGSAGGCPNSDQDGDGVQDQDDNCPSATNSNQSNLDGDSEGDACDSDIDGDGLSNDVESTAGTSPTSGDTDGDSISDSVESNGGQFVDTDRDGIVDGADTDTDGDGRPDSQEGTGDQDQDGIPDWRDPVTPVRGVLKLEMNIDYDVTWLNDGPRIPLLNRAGSNRLIVSGATSAQLRGSDALLSQVREVCVDVLWRTVINRPVGSYPVHWEENGVDLNGPGDTRWNNPPSPSGFSSELTLDEPQCTQGSAVVWTTTGITAEINRFRGANFVALAHEATITVRLWDGRVFTDRITEREKAASKPPRVEDFDNRKNGRQIRI